MKIIDDALLNNVCNQAKASPRLRMNYNFHQNLMSGGVQFVPLLECRQQMAVGGGGWVPARAW